MYDHVYGLLLSGPSERRLTGSLHVIFVQVQGALFLSRMIHHSLWFISTMSAIYPLL